MMNTVRPGILVGHFDSPFVRRVAITLTIYGVPFERDRTSVFSDAMQDVNPLVRIPTFVTPNGEKLFDSFAILDHLDEEAPSDRVLLPRTGRDRRRALRAIIIATGAIEKAGAVVYERHFHPGTMRSAEWESRCLRQLTSALEYLERECASPWFLGPPMTQADVTVGCLIAYLRLRLPEGFETARYPALSALAALCDSHDAFRSTKPSTDEQMPAGGRATTYRTRPIRFLGDQTIREWRLKTYGIALHGQRPRESLVRAGLDRAAEILPRQSDTRLGFIIIHDATNVCFANYYWWESGNELHQRILMSPREAPMELTPVTHPAVGCVWEPEVIDFERRAWLNDVLRLAQPDYAAYVSRRCNADV